MSEGHVGNFVRSFQNRLFGWLFLLGAILLGAIWALYTFVTTDLLIVLGAAGILWLLLIMFASWIMTAYFTKPMNVLAQAILHISPHEHLTAPPDIQQLRLGRELVTTLTRQMYDFATATSATGDTEMTSNTPLDELPIAVLGIGEDGTITLANQTLLQTFGLESLISLPLAEQFEITSSNHYDTLQSWIEQSRQTSVHAKRSWRKVQIRARNGDFTSYFDIVASFRHHHSSGTETLLLLFDHQDIYQAEADALSFISLAVHELRTPLTILRGYIEVIEEEFAGKLSPELQTVMQRMSTSAQNLSAFVTNILSVAKADQNQLSLRLVEENWQQTLSEFVDMMRSRASVRGKQLNLTVADGLPAVAIDKVSISEVLTNLIDNAIKYSPDEATTITINAALDESGNVLTTVEDHGVGIPESVVPNLFNKFYRNHRNRTAIVGTGLGLYLSKVIVTAHHGNIWIKSKEGVGTTVGFTLVPYAQLAEALRHEDDGITRSRHGWIKNHSMQRR